MNMLLKISQISICILKKNYVDLLYCLPFFESCKKNEKFKCLFLQLCQDSVYTDVTVQAVSCTYLITNLFTSLGKVSIKNPSSFYY